MTMVIIAMRMLLTTSGPTRPLYRNLVHGNWSRFHSLPSRMAMQEGTGLLMQLIPGQGECFSRSGLISPNRQVVQLRMYIILTCCAFLMEICRWEAPSSSCLHPPVQGALLGH